MNRKTVKKLIAWIGILIAVHIIAMIIFGIIFSNSVASMSEQDAVQANLTVLIFNIVFYSLFSIFYFKVETSYIDYRRTLKEALKTEDFSLLNFLINKDLKEHIIMLGIFAVFQLPFVIFYSILGMSLVYTTIFEQFFIMDAGSYLLTDSSLLGVILNTVIFGIVFTLSKLLFNVICKRDIEKEMIR